MFKVSDLAKQILESDELALESLRGGLLNLSAYAAKIQPQIEKITYKEIKKGTIVVALSRIAKGELKTLELKPQVKLTNLTVRSALTCMHFDKTLDIQRRVSSLNPFHVALNDLFSLTEGPSEVTLVCQEKSREKIVEYLGVEPKDEQKDMVAITAELPKEYIDTPNVLYVLVESLATKRIPIYSLTTTVTEVSFVVKATDMEQALQALNLYFKKSS